MKVGALAFAAILLLIACGNPNDEEVIPPPSLLSRDQFTDVLVDYALAESVSNLNLKSVTPIQFDTVYAFNPIRARNIRKSQFDSTVLFYSAHPRAYRHVYDTVLSRLNTLRLAREKSKTQAPSK
jgi:hypothetical protein